MVGRRIICSPPRHENSLRRNDVHGTGSGNIGIEETEAKHKNLDGVGARWSVRLHAYDYMGQIFIGSTRLHCER